MSSEPVELIVGDTWRWTSSIADYPADTWTLTYYFRSLDGEFGIECTAIGVDHVAEVAAATSADYSAGFYSWVSVVTNGSSRYTIGRGATTLKPDPAETGAGLDPRSHARKVLEAIEAVIEGRATTDQEEYTIGMRSLKRTPIADLLTLRDRYVAAVADEDAAAKAAAGLGNPRKASLRFYRP